MQAKAPELFSLAATCECGDDESAFREEAQGKDQELLCKALQDKANLQAQVQQLRGQVSLTVRL